MHTHIRSALAIQAYECTHTRSVLVIQAYKCTLTHSLSSRDRSQRRHTLAIQANERRNTFWQPSQYMPTNAHTHARARSALAIQANKRIHCGTLWQFSQHMPTNAHTHTHAQLSRYYEANKCRHTLSSRHLPLIHSLLSMQQNECRHTFSCRYVHMHSWTLGPHQKRN